MCKRGFSTQILKRIFMEIGGKLNGPLDDDVDYLIRQFRYNI